MQFSVLLFENTNKNHTILHVSRLENPVFTLFQYIAYIKYSPILQTITTD